MARPKASPPDPDTPAWQTHAWTAQEVTFVSEVLRHGKLGDAHRTAFPELYKDATNGSRMTPAHIRATANGGALAHKPGIASYLAHVRGLMKQRLALSKDTVLEELAKLGFANMSHFVVLQADGTPQFDVSGLDADQFAAIQEMTIDTYMDGKGDDGREVRSVKVKLAPKLGALELLGKHLKLFTDVLDVGGAGDLAATIRDRKLARRKATETDGHEPGSEGSQE